MHVRCAVNCLFFCQCAIEDTYTTTFQWSLVCFQSSATLRLIKISKVQSSVLSTLVNGGIKVMVSSTVLAVYGRIGFSVSPYPMF